jgi:hypothetical protein
MKMVEYRVVSCIGQIIIDTDIALLLLAIFIPDEYRTSGAILISHGSIKNPDNQNYRYYTPYHGFTFQVWLSISALCATK